MPVFEIGDLIMGEMRPALAPARIAPTRNPAIAQLK